MSTSSQSLRFIFEFETVLKFYNLWPDLLLKDLAGERSLFHDVIRVVLSSLEVEE